MKMSRITAIMSKWPVINGSSRQRWLQELMETDPPGITFKAKDIDLVGVASILSRVTGKPFNALGTIPPPAYTLETEGMRFWEIYRALNEQEEFSFSNGISALGLRRPVLTKWDQMQMHRGFALFLKKPEPAGDGSAAYKTRVDLGFDPRIEVATVGTPEFSGVTDERGKRWTVEVPQSNGIPLGNRAILISHTHTVTAPEGAGKVLTVAGVWPVQIAEEWKTVELKDLTKPPEGALVFGQKEVTITQLALTDTGLGNWSLRLTMQNNSPKAVAAAGVRREAALRAMLMNQEPQFEVVLMDSAGTVLVTKMVPGTVNMNTNVTVVEKVAKVVLKYPVKLRGYRVPFEFKDVAAGG